MPKGVSPSQQNVTRSSCGPSRSFYDEDLISDKEDRVLIVVARKA